MAAKQQQPSQAGDMTSAGLSTGAYYGGQYLYDHWGNIIGSAAPSVTPVATTATQAALGLGDASAPFGFLTDASGASIGTAAPPVAPASSFLGTAAPYLGALAAVHGGYNLVSNFGNQSALQGGLSGAETGAGIGTMVLPGVGTAVGAGVGALAGLASSLFHDSGKDKDQKRRDAVRAGLKKAGVIDDAYNITTAGGNKFDIGRDGSEKLYNFDPNSTPYTTQVSGYAIPLSYLAGGGDQKLSSDFTGYFTNAALSDAKDASSAKANVLAIANKFGDANAIKGQLTQLKDQGKLDQAHYDAALNGVDSLFDINAYAASKGGGTQGNSTAPKKKVAVVQPQPEVPIAPVFTPAATSYAPSVMPGSATATHFGGGNSYADLLEDMKRRASVGRTI